MQTSFLPEIAALSAIVLGQKCNYKMASDNVYALRSRGDEVSWMLPSREIWRQRHLLGIVYSYDDPAHQTEIVPSVLSGSSLSLKLALSVTALRMEGREEEAARLERAGNLLRYLLYGQSIHLNLFANEECLPLVNLTVV